MVVGPHGAGLANLLYVAPGSTVIEGVCNRPHVNLCFQWLATVLGHRYHAIPSRRGCEGVVDIDTELFVSVVKTYLEMFHPIPI